MHIKNVSSTSKIKEILKENIAYDPLFMKKMQKIHTKNSSCSSIGINQLTHSNLFGSNMNKIQLETSLQNKALKNSSSHTKNLKKNNNSLEEHSSSNHYKPSSPRFEKANLVKDKNSSFIMENNKFSSMKSISSNKFNKLYNIFFSHLYCAIVIERCTLLLPLYCNNSISNRLNCCINLCPR